MCVQTLRLRCRPPAARCGMSLAAPTAPGVVRRARAWRRAASVAHYSTTPASPRRPHRARCTGAGVGAGSSTLDELFSAPSPRALEEAYRDAYTTRRAMEKSFEALDRQSEEVFRRALTPPQGAERLGGGGSGELDALPGSYGWERESRKEDGSSRLYTYERVQVWGGGEVPAQPSLSASLAAGWLVAAAAVAAWAAGAWRLVKGLDRTTLGGAPRDAASLLARAAAVALWPVLALASQRFRAQLLRAWAKEGGASSEPVDDVHKPDTS